MLQKHDLRLIGKLILSPRVQPSRHHYDSDFSILVGEFNQAFASCNRISVHGIGYIIAALSCMLRSKIISEDKIVQSTYRVVK
ncbi:MAG: hypothetical protein MUP73_02240 [Dehalococcoidia bacterium]|nr:hypothetical protein [Dehalococcoidia bacterium]